jgi:hypothetical protein
MLHYSFDIPEHAEKVIVKLRVRTRLAPTGSSSCSASTTSALGSTLTRVRV